MELYGAPTARKVVTVIFAYLLRGGTTIEVYRVGCVGEQATVSDKVRCVIDRRYVVSGRRHYDRRAMRECECVRYDDKAASWLAPKGDDGRFDLWSF